MRDARHDVWTRSLGSGGGGGADSSLSPAAPAMGVGRTLARGSSLTRPLGTGLTTSSASASARASGRDTGHGVLPTIDTQTTLTVIDDEKQSNISTTDIRMTIHSIYFTLL
jgi:hypothetical protein